MVRGLLLLWVMNNSNPRVSRVQTTVSVLGDSIEALDQMSTASNVSRSRLIDLAIRRFIRWSSQLDPADLALIAEYEVTEPVSGFLRRPASTPASPPPPSAPAEIPAPRAKPLSSSAPPARVRDKSSGRYLSEAPPPKRKPVPTT